MNVRDNIAAGKYDNKVPYDVSEMPPIDAETTTIAEAERLRVAHKERKAAQKLAHRQEDGRLDAIFEADLAEEHGLTNHPKRGRLYSIAYERGHAYGRSDVVSVYEELAELLTP
jgi:hypothetical protein